MFVPGDFRMNEQPNPTDPQSKTVEEPEEISVSEETPSVIPGKNASSVGTQVPFPIVGIGASAGGLEALEMFLKNVPPGSGMAFIIVQHLDPTHKGIMVELLQRGTPMPVIQVTDRLKVEPDTVYVIPPNKDMSILKGVLHLFAPVAPRGLRLPIDFFFRTLADDLQERSVGVILSGMGSDGTLGLRAIKEKAGVVFVQAPASAKFDGMPRSAIDAGLADVVAVVEELPGKIITYLQHTPLLTHPDLILKDKAQSALEKIFILLRLQTHHDFSLYKKSTIYRRIERRMAIHQIDRIMNYVRLLQENPQETELLFKELLIGVTSFFRDPAAWELLKSEIIPSLLAARPAGMMLRAWTPGCSTGEEAYSLAIVFKEALEQVKPAGNFSLQIFATDLDQDAIDKARQGLYPANIAADVSPERLRRFFIKEEQGYRVGKEIRETVIFAQQNLAMDAPFTHLDLLVCRNLLIYLDGELQKKLLPLFHYSLNPDGILFLGSAETIGGYTNLFTALTAKQRLYRRQNFALSAEQIDFPTALFPAVVRDLDTLKPQHSAQQPALNLQVLADQLLLQHFAPAAVLVSDEGDILYINGRTGKYLEPAAGKANWNIFAMAREGLRYELNKAFKKALSEKNPVMLKNLVVGTNGGKQMVNLTVHPIIEPEALRGMVMIVFTEVAALPVTKAPIKSGKASSASEASAYQAQLEQELQRAHEELQTTREEMQTSQEELKSANEELQSTNEELQSTNEELTTSKEEMQSLNEELQTVNHELQARVDELSQSNNDMRNLLNSTNIATLFLDDALHVRRFTNQASQIIKLIPGDAGRPITDIASDLLYPELAEDVQEVLRTLVFKEKPINTRDGRWFSMRIMPYRTFENRIDGVVITFMDISVAKKLEAVLRESEREMKAHFKYMPNAFALFEPVFNEDGIFVSCRFVFMNDAYEQIMAVKNEEVKGKTIHQVWPSIETSWIKIFGQVTRTGVPDCFEMDHPSTGKRFRCYVYRPGESQERFCVIFEDTNGTIDRRLDPKTD
jgi:two-component system CheB/CheR fusion protein